MHAYLYKPKRCRGSKSVAGKFWRVRWKSDGDKRYADFSLHTTDKVVAGEKLRAFVEEKGRESAGIIAPRPLRDAAQKKMVDHLSDFLNDLKARRRDSMYSYTLGKRCEKLITECAWVFPKDVTGDSFGAWRDVQSLSPKTLNGYLGDMSAFLNWMKRRGRIVANPLLGAVGKVSMSGVDSKRRAMTDDELRRLLGVAGERRLVYLAAVRTGLRRSELEGLRWGDVSLDSPKPFLRARASTTKNGKLATIWLASDLAGYLRAARPVDVAGGVFVFPQVPSMDLFRADLAAAEIPQVDDAGRELVFHCFRNTLATQMARANVPPRVAMETMRHSDLRLTMATYTDAALLPTSDVLDKLPDLEAVLALGTGTDGAVNDAQNHAQDAFPAGSNVSRGADSESGQSASKVVKKAGKSGVLSHSVPSGVAKAKNWGTRIRT